MDNQSNLGRDDSPQSLGSAEYRTRLLTKLNCLIAVLEVAIAKLTRSMELPGANEDRLLKIRSNLENTLSICSRAKQSLEKSMTPSLPAPEARTATAGSRDMTYRDYVELGSIEEYQKFKKMTPISTEDISHVDVEDLIRRLMGS
jgi:hypothetical protein